MTNRATRAQILELLLGPNGKSVFENEEQSQNLWREVRTRISAEFASSWFCETGETKDFVAIAEQYARDVVDGQIPACKWTRLACLRHLEDLERAAGGGWDYRFDAAKAARVCRFAELFPHVKGTWAARSERIVLQPWQIFILCALFGWMKRDTGYRRFTLAVLIIARKNGKSILAAVIGNYLAFADEEFGAEVYSGATTEDQAWEVFRPARDMMVRSPELTRMLGLRMPTYTSKKLEMPENGSRFEPVVGKPGDGASVHGGLVDEYHEHDSDALFDTFRTGMGARTQPLQLVISTAGTNTAGPCRLLQGDVEKLLDGQFVREECFGIIYTVDDPRAWATEESLAQANPNMGVSVSREFLLTEQRTAVANPRKRGTFCTKHLNIWVGAMSTYFDIRRWNELADPHLKIDSFVGLPCVVSDDLSTKRDFTCRVVEFKKQQQGKDHYYLFAHLYLPDEQMKKPENAHYKEWEKHIEVHPGATVDFEQIEQDTAEVVKKTHAREFAFDPWNAAQLAQGLAKDTKVATVEVQQTTKNLSPAMKDLDALIAEGRIHHDGNPVLAWMLGNVMAREDANENVFPRKEEGRAQNKIDGAVATIMAHSRLMLAAPKRSVYATRGVLTVPTHA